MLLEINASAPEYPKIQQAVKVLEKGGVIAYPTDTIYGIGCDVYNKQAVEKIHRLKQTSSNKPMSMIIADLSDISKYAIIGDYAYKILKKCLPGPYTFILKATKFVPKELMPQNKNTIGIRIPDSAIALELVKALDKPIITTSANIHGQQVYSDPLEIEEKFGHELDLVIDGGVLINDGSTIVDLTTDQPLVIREGKGEISRFI